MEYYILAQDNLVSNYPMIKDKGIIKSVFNDAAPLYCESKQYTSTRGYVELPFIDRPCFMVSDKLREIFSCYQEGGQFRTVVLDGIDGYGVLYYFFQPFLLDCLSDQTVFYSRMTVKELVLDERKICGNKVFQVAGLSERYLIIDLEILELMLCGGVNPIAFKKVAVEKHD